MTLNELTTAVTAFPSFMKFAEAMNNGYVPTLRPERGRSKRAKEQNARVAELAYRLEELGWRVWRG